MVDVDAEPCKGKAAPTSKETLELVREARRKLGLPAATKWRPVPVAAFFASRAAMVARMLLQGRWCINICHDDVNKNFRICLNCCLWFPNCIITVSGPDIPI